MYNINENQAGLKNEPNAEMPKTAVPRMAIWGWLQKRVDSNRSPLNMLWCLVQKRVLVSLPILVHDNCTGGDFSIYLISLNYINAHSYA